MDVLTLRERYHEFKTRGLALDLTRGKPAPEQLDLSNQLLALPGVGDYVDASGTDTRNYGGLTGLLELREIFSELLDVPAAQLIAGNNASLEVMHRVLVNCLVHGTTTSQRPWMLEDRIAFICPIPGYDRHFTLTESFGIEMLTVPMTPEGPDIEAVAELVRNDPTVKGMWLVPTYANPSGAVTSPEIAAQLAALETAAPDFRIFWDNAYAVHHLTEHETVTPPIVELCAQAGNPDRAFLFASTSKITFAGAGVGFFGSSADNIAWYLRHFSKESIGPDKVNQLRHAKFFGDADGVRGLMAKHREILAPKFATVERMLAENLTGIASWTQPNGGYFVSLDVPEGCASRVVELAKDAGVALTPAGSAFPYGRDPHDRNIRIAPSFPSIDDLTAAMEGLILCVLLAVAESTSKPNLSNVNSPLVN